MGGTKERRGIEWKETPNEFPNSAPMTDVRTNGQIKLQ